VRCSLPLCRGGTRSESSKGRWRIRCSSRGRLSPRDTCVAWRPPPLRTPTRPRSAETLRRAARVTVHSARTDSRYEITNTFIS
jgi:hypothetical protein